MLSSVTNEELREKFSSAYLLESELMDTLKTYIAYVSLIHPFFLSTEFSLENQQNMYNLNPLVVTNFSFAHCDVKESYGHLPTSTDHPHPFYLNLDRHE